MKQMLLEPKQRPQVNIWGDLKEGAKTLVRKTSNCIERGTAALKEGAETLVRNVDSFFATTKQTKVDVVTPKVTTQETVLLYGKHVQSAELLTISNQLSRYYYQTQVHSFNVKSIYQNIKDDLVLTVVPYVSAIGGASGASYEEILMKAMDMARMANNPITRGIDALPMLDNLLKKDLIEADSFNVNRTTLAIIWSSLILALFSKWRSSIGVSVWDEEIQRIVKSGIALSLGVGVSFVQF